VLIAATLIALMLAMQARGATMAVAVGGFVTLAVVFVWWERRSPAPIFDVELFAVRSFVAGTVLIALQNLVMYTLLFELPQVLQKLLALNEAGVGRLLIVMMMTMVVTSLVAGQLTDMFGPRLLAASGTLFCLAGVGLLAGALTTPEQVLLPLVLIGTGLGLATPSAQSASLTRVRREQSGTAAGMNSTMRYLGGIVGIALLGRFLDSGGDRTEVISDHRRMLTVFACALVVGLVCAALLPGRDRRTTTVADTASDSRSARVQPEPETT
jgi:MFS family permease